MSSPCPSEETLSAYARSALEPDAMRAVGSHLASCAGCRTRVEKSLGATVDSSGQTRTVLSPKGAPGREASALPPGAKVGRYLVLDKLGAGGMGVVYAAFDPELDRKVALKLLKEAGHAGLGESAGRARLLREAQALAQLAHPNVISVHDVGTFEDQVFVAMELFDGITLKEWLRAPHPLSERLSVARAAGEGLNAAHAAGLIHRDFKPENVLVSSALEVRVLDFGLARAAEEARPDLLDSSTLGAGDSLVGAERSLSRELTLAGTVMGTPGYMAPEQYRGEPADARSDQFAFAATLYEVLHGAPPFSGHTLAELSQASARGISARPAGSPLPARFWPLIARGLAPDPTDRFENLRALLDALARAARPFSLRHLPALIACSGVLVVSLAAFAYARVARGRAQTCAGVDAPLARIWGPTIAERLERAFASTHVPHAEDTWRGVARVLDTYARDWTGLTERACVAARIQGTVSDGLYGRQVACLDGRLGALRALIGVYADPDTALVDRALEAATRLPWISACADLQTLQAESAPPAKAIAQAVKDASGRLEEAHALELTGRYASGLSAARAVVTRAKRLGYRPLTAKALLEEARLERVSKRYPDALRSIAALTREAEAARADNLLARGWTLAITIQGLGLGQTEIAQLYANQIQGLLDGMKNPAPLEGDFENALGALALGQRKYDEARAHFEKALASRRKVLGPTHPQVAAAYNNLGIVEGHLHHAASAEQDFRSALRIDRKVLGAQHPRLGRTLQNLGNLYRREGRFDLALEKLQQALAIKARAEGKDSATYGIGLVNLSAVEGNLGHYARMADDAARGLAILERRAGEGSRWTAIGLENLALAEHKLGRHARALKHASRALAFWTQKGQSPKDRARLLAEVGAEQVSLGQRAKGVRALEQAVALFRSQAKGEVRGDGAARAALARALWPDPRARKRARALAHAAYRALNDGKGDGFELRALQRWWAEVQPGAPL